MATSKSKRRSRKRRQAGTAPRAVASQRREVTAERRVLAERQTQRSRSTLGKYGDPPESPFGFPVSEIAIFAGIVGAIVGFFSGAPVALGVGVVVITLGVLEVTAREHFSGYRSHATLLAAIPAIAIGIGIVALIGHGSVRRGLSGPNRAALLVIVPVFGLLFWLLGKRFRAARQARIVRPPGS